MHSVDVYLILSKQNKQSINYIYHTCVQCMLLILTETVWIRCVALCPLHKYLQNCTFRSFQYTLYCTSKLLLALEFKDNVSVTSTYNYVSLNNEIVVLKASSTR